jgi:hypothetical protein
MIGFVLDIAVVVLGVYVYDLLKERKRKKRYHG